MYITRSKQNGAQLHSRESATFAYCETVMGYGRTDRQTQVIKVDKSTTVKN